MKRFYSQFVHKDSLVFDVGANIGSRTAVFLELGVRQVVAVEPQHHLCLALRDRFPSDLVMIECAVAGPESGMVDLLLCTDNQLATCASGWAESLHDRWPMEKWTNTLSVPQVTLDELIAEYGVPDFIKIDVEGYEDQVLKGLTTSVEALSFEFTVPYLGPAIRSLELVEHLGLNRFNYLAQEVMELRCNTWVSAHMMKGILGLLPISLFYGDVFATQEEVLMVKGKGSSDEKLEEVEVPVSVRPSRPEVPIKDGMIIGCQGDGIWVMDAGTRRLVPDVNTQILMGIGMHHVVMVHLEQLESIEKGPPMPRLKPKGRLWKRY